MKPLKMLSLITKWEIAFRHKGLRFQYIDGETPESFMKRLNSLYKREWTST